MPLDLVEIFWANLKEALQIKLIQLIKERYQLPMANPPQAPVPVAVPVNAVAVPAKPLLSIVSTLLTVSSNVLNDSLKPLIRKWDNPPTATQVLEVWDLARGEHMASMAALAALEQLYDERSKEEMLAAAQEAKNEEGT